MGDLADMMEGLEEHHWLREQTCAAYVGQALVALAHSHASKVYHHDLRPSSILLSSKMPDALVVVADVGLAAILDPENEASRANPSPYEAPELAAGGPRM